MTIPSSIAIFQNKCQEGAKLWCAGVDLHQVVDDLQDYAVRSGLVTSIGQDLVQHYMAEAFKPYRRVGDLGIYQP
jgi:hypothetical protein